MQHYIARTVEKLAEEWPEHAAVLQELAAKLQQAGMQPRNADQLQSALLLLPQQLRETATAALKAIGATVLGTR